jgi:hypothetical protein
MEWGDLRKATVCRVLRDDSEWFGWEREESSVSRRRNGSGKAGTCLSSWSQELGWHVPEGDCSVLVLTRREMMVKFATCLTSAQLCFHLV